MTNILIIEGPKSEVTTIVDWARPLADHIDIVSSVDEGLAIGRKRPLSLIVTAAERVDVLRNHRELDNAAILAFPSPATIDAWSELDSCKSDDVVNLPVGRREFVARCRRAMSRHSGAAPQKPADQDRMTGLPTQVALIESIAAYETRARRSGDHFALFAMSLANLQSVNQCLGRSVGDQLLRAFAQRLSKIADDDSLIARIGGDEFVLIERVKSVDDATTRGAELLSQLQAAFDIAGESVSASVNMGLSTTPDDAATIEALLRRNTRSITPPNNDHGATHGRKAYRAGDVAQIGEAAELTDAVRTGELLLHYQTQINLETGRVAGAEALLRWKRAGHGLIMPAAFLPMAARNSLLGQISEWVFDRVASDLYDWARRKTDMPRISINVSAHEACGSSLIDLVEHLADKRGINPQQIDIEIPFAVTEDEQLARMALETLRGMGVSLTLEMRSADIIGVTPALNGLAFNRVKLDRSVIKLAEVNGVVEKARDAGAAIVAGGVESAQQLAAVRALGCIEAQGYYFSRPTAAGDVLKN